MIRPRVRVVRMMDGVGARVVFAVGDVVVVLLCCCCVGEQLVRVQCTWWQSTWLAAERLACALCVILLCLSM